jgi:hypothetical protein
VRIVRVVLSFSLLLFACAALSAGAACADDGAIL